MNTPQHRIHSGFGARSTATEVLEGIDLAGRLAIVTGGYSGLGLETTRALAAAGATVVVPSRRRAHAEEVLSGSTASRSTRSTWATSAASTPSPTASSRRTAPSTS